MNKPSPQVILEKLRTISSIPTLPSVVEKLTRLLQNPQTSAEELGKAISTDQALASKVLRLVNSAFYGFPGKIGTITHAVVILGFSTVKNIVLTASIFDFFRRPGSEHPDFDIEKFWLHSIACGAASQSLAKQAGYAEKEECFIGGLVHDIGKIVLCQYMPMEFGQIVANVRAKDTLFYEAEQEVLGITHQEIGGLLAERWNLPTSIAEVVKFHHHPSRSRQSYRMTAIVHAADVLIRALDHGNGGDQKIPLISDEVWKDLGLWDLPLLPVITAIDDEVQKAATLLECI